MYRVDAFVGARLKARRKRLHLRQADVAEKLGVSYQQVQKYERGSSPLAVRQLVRLAAMLEVPVSYFLTGLQEKGPEPATGIQPEAAEWLHSPEALRFAALIASAAPPDRGRILAIAQLLSADTDSA